MSGSRYLAGDVLIHCTQLLTIHVLQSICTTKTTLSTYIQLGVPDDSSMDQFCDKRQLKMFASIEKGQLGVKGILPTHGE